MIKRIVAKVKSFTQRSSRITTGSAEGLTVSRENHNTTPVELTQKSVFELNIQRGAKIDRHIELDQKSASELNIPGGTKIDRHIGLVSRLVGDLWHKLSDTKNERQSEAQAASSSILDHSDSSFINHSQSKSVASEGVILDHSDSSFINYKSAKSVASESVILERDTNYNIVNNKLTQSIAATSKDAYIQTSAHNEYTTDFECAYKTPSDLVISRDAKNNIDVTMVTHPAYTMPEMVSEPYNESHVDIVVKDADEAQATNASQNKRKTSLRTWIYPEKGENNNLIIKQAFAITQKENILEVI